MFVSHALVSHVRDSVTLYLFCQNIFIQLQNVIFSFFLSWNLFLNIRHSSSSFFFFLTSSLPFDRLRKESPKHHQSTTWSQMQKSLSDAEVGPWPIWFAVRSQLMFLQDGSCYSLFELSWSGPSCAEEVVDVISLVTCCLSLIHQIVNDRLYILFFVIGQGQCRSGCGFISTRKDADVWVRLSCGGVSRYIVLLFDVWSRLLRMEGW